MESLKGVWQTNVKAEPVGQQVKTLPPSQQLCLLCDPKHTILRTESPTVPYSRSRTHCGTRVLHTFTHKGRLDWLKLLRGTPSEFGAMLLPADADTSKEKGKAKGRGQIRDSPAAPQV